MFLIVLSDRGFTQSFGSSGGYLSGALRKQGELVQNYYAVAPSPLANEIAMTSGQGPTAQTASDCPVFSHIKPGTKGPRGQVLGNGCAYPTITKTLASQLTAAHDTWKAYVQGVPASQKSACRGPEGREQGAADGALEEHVPGLAQPVRVLPRADRRGRLPHRRGRLRPTVEGSEER